VLAVVYAPLVVATNEVMTETWFTFWLVLAAWLLLDAARDRAEGLGRLLAGGAAIGLAALTRPVGLLLWPALAVTVGWRLRREGVKRALWVGLATAAVLLPWSARNWQVFGTWVPLATHGGFILARSNADQPAWREEHGWGIEESFFRQIPSEVERDRYWRAQGLDWIRSHPGRYLRLAGERFLRFWYFLRPDYNFWYMLVLPFFAVGFWRYRGDPDLALFRWFIGLSVVVFSFVLYGSTRFRLPLEPFFLVYAASLGRDLWDHWGWRRAGLLLGAALAVNLLAELGDERLRALVLALLAQGQLK
jgi:4-amino-4-deoxy-L-arabinose transferase-like glycosyltransferase